MGLRTQDTAIDVRKGMRPILGRIFVDPNDGSVVPFLVVKGGKKAIPLQSIINAISADAALTDQGVVHFVDEPGLCPDDVATTRAYLHRFGPDLKHPQHLPSGAKAIVLDENMPDLAMVPLTKIFGWTTHVRPEGLAGRDTPDESIWEFTHKNGFGCIVTRDSDFLEIQNRRARQAVEEGLRPPLLVHVTENMSVAAITTLFMRHAGDIRDLQKSVQTVACTLSSSDGCRPVF